MNDVFEAVAVMPGVGIALRQGDKAFVLRLDGRVLPQFSSFPEAAITKYGYRRLKPFSGSLQDMKDLLSFLSQRSED